MTISRRVSELEEKYKRLETAYRSELEAEINASIGFNSEKDHDLTYVRLSKLEICDGDSIEDYFFKIKIYNEQIGFIFPFRTRAFINGLASKHNDLVKTLEKRGYVTHVKASWQSAKDIVDEFRKYSGTE